MSLSTPITLLAYDCPHRKTFDVATQLRANGYTRVTILAQSMFYRKTYQPLLQHRPSVYYPIDTETLCKNLGYSYFFIKNEQELTNYIHQNSSSLYLISGISLLPEQLLTKAIFINTHPGYSPYTRGLDAFKWAIYKNLPIGVTIHILKKNCEIDTGILIKKVMLKPTEQDTFHSMAQKVYETEIQELINSVETYKEALQRNQMINPLPGFPATRRMPNEIEKTIDLTLKNYHCDESLYNHWE